MADLLSSSPPSSPSIRRLQSARESSEPRWSVLREQLTLLSQEVQSELDVAKIDANFPSLDDVATTVESVFFDDKSCVLSAEKSSSSPGTSGSGALTSRGLSHPFASQTVPPAAGHVSVSTRCQSTTTPSPLMVSTGAQCCLLQRPQTEQDDDESKEEEEARIAEEEARMNAMLVSLEERIRELQNDLEEARLEKEIFRLKYEALEKSTTMVSGCDDESASANDNESPSPLRIVEQPARRTYQAPTPPTNLRANAKEAHPQPKPQQKAVRKLDFRGASSSLPPPTPSPAPIKPSPLAMHRSSYTVAAAHPIKRSPKFSNDVGVRKELLGASKTSAPERRAGHADPRLNTMSGSSQRQGQLISPSAEDVVEPREPSLMGYTPLKSLSVSPAAATRSSNKKLSSALSTPPKHHHQYPQGSGGRENSSLSRRHDSSMQHHEKRFIDLLNDAAAEAAREGREREVYF